jgi:hypothetical protein
VLQATAVRTAQALTSSAGPVPVTPMDRGKRQCPQTRQQHVEAEQQRRHAPWVTCYEAIHARQAQRTPLATIARQLGISRPTVYASLRRAMPPAPRSPQRSGQVLRPYMPYLIRRWREGLTDSMRLWREIQAQGYTHSARPVSRVITSRRRAAEAGQAPEARTSPYTRPQGPATRTVSLHLGVPQRQAGARSPDVCGAALPGGRPYGAGASVDVDPGVPGARAQATGRRVGSLDR